MARLTRLALAGHLHQVALRGHSGMAVFRDDTDRRAFLDALQAAVRQHAVAVHAYALLESEVHWLATPSRADALGRAVQSLGRQYVSAFNRRHQRSGTLWEGRFRSSVLDPSAWLMPAMVYVETLPVVQHLSGLAAEWPWSSAAAHLGRQRDTLLTDHPAYFALGNTPFERERVHADLLFAGLPGGSVSALEAALRRGMALGDESFLQELQRHADRPVNARPRGRPRR